jgi:hypothetical protein
MSRIRYVPTNLPANWFWISADSGVPWITTRRGRLIQAQRFESSSFWVTKENRIHMLDDITSHFEEASATMHLT